MDRWYPLAPGYWRQDTELPIGHVVAEIRKQEYLPLYSVRVEVTLPPEQVPQQMIKTAVGLLNIAEAQMVYGRLLGEIVTTTTLALARQMTDGVFATAE